VGRKRPDPQPDHRLRIRECQWAVLAIGRGLLLIGVILGTLIIVGGDLRWSSPSFAVAKTYPYAPTSWGWLLGLLSVVGLIGSIFGRFRLVASTLFVMAVWCMFFGISFFVTAIDNPKAATTPVPIYLGMAVGSVVIGQVHWRSRCASDE
jgi:hypothetical protein